MMEWNVKTYVLRDVYERWHCRRLDVYEFKIDATSFSSRESMPI